MIIFPYIPRENITKGELFIMLILYSSILLYTFYIWIIKPIIENIQDNIKYNKRKKEESKKDKEFTEKILKLIKENESNKSNR